VSTKRGSSSWGGKTFFPGGGHKRGLSGALTEQNVCVAKKKRLLPPFVKGPPLMMFLLKGGSPSKPF